ncbi:PREDICTED: uncharacterized protein LOC106307942 isoform X1 [Brassica oleracea var. oleracea]|uniref:uncharacterized protein LOC106307942 isoform X1 n=1 Tax=Brassica oleracea var. oleracea TaxID=109376 RepID=UPI0006A74449|nr:PREDICTED: uncharacterized protein LOC106307942 isoform X1 [Brassica oleracea var. oleracea]
MGNNNATANLTEEESTKLETNGMSPLENVPVETTQDQVFLVGEGKDGDKQRESFSDGVTGKETPETEPQSKELDKDPQVTKVEEDMSRNGLVTETDEQLHKNTSVGEGVETVCEPTKWEEFNETAGTEEKLVMNESLEETAPAGNVVRLDQEICMEQRTWFPEIEPQEILNLDSGVLDDEVINEGKADKEISEPGSQGSNAIGFEDYKEEKDMEIAREAASLKRMSRCRSLPVRNNSRVKGDSPVQGLVSEVAYPSRNKTGFDKAKTSDILPVSCQTSNKGQETTKAINESSKEAKLEMRSPSFSNDLRIEERSNEPTEETPLLSQDKTEKYKATLDVEEEAVMLKRSETEKIRGFELSLGLSMNLSGRCDADDSFKETESSEDNLLEEKRNMSETLLVSCVGSKKAEDTNDVISERNKGDVLEMRSPSSGIDLRTKERSGKSTEETSLLSQDKTEAYNSTPNVEEKTVMLKRSETEKLRGFELSLGLSMNLSGRCDGDGSFKEINSSEDNLGDKEANTSETLFVSCVGSSSSKAQEASLLCQDKTETYEATIDVEKKTVMLKRSESEETRGFELSRELSMKPGERSEADDSLKENKDSGDNLLDKKASWGSMRGRVRKRSKSSLFGTCLCCNIAMN